MRPGGNLERRKLFDRFMLGLLILGSLLVVAPLVLVLGKVFLTGLSALNLAFFVEPYRPLDEGGGGLAHAIVGTLMMNLLALLIGGLLGLAGGILLSEYPDHPVNPFLRVISDLLNGLPALLKGLVIYTLFVIPMGRFTGLAGALALALVMVPIVLRATEGVLKLVPWSVREAGLALGLPRWRVILSLVLPSALPGVITGLMLGFARAAGEAAPLYFTAGGNLNLSFSLGDQVESLALTIYKYAGEPSPVRQEQAWAASLVLTLLVLAAGLLARWATRKR
ncbi:phosphate ABC transporter permease PstA [Calidithermus chliarophilus]|uniref:phosphate ABC transporter permease PstA n=1 Tax=Calidithermus chliarophilus TaxID=52023 RepID=UPI000419EC2F|nr:phosphate ABC transporter permease PstA [Calidithermus chliarophilus]